MSLRKLPQASLPARPQNFQGDAPSDVMARWAETPQAAASDDAAVIDIFGLIGTDYWTGESNTPSTVGAALARAGRGDVTVRVNSPGGDMFDGIGIYNMLAAHPGKVSIEVLGWAASAASVIAMAGDTVTMGAGSFIMVHDAWGLTVGNRHDFTAAADLFAQFDAALVDIYVARTGMKPADVAALMDAGNGNGTFMSVDEAIAKGFTDGKMTAAAAQAHAAAPGADAALMARRRTEAALAAAGFSRADRSQMIAAMGSTKPSGQRDATTHPAARDAGDVMAGLDRLLANLSN